LSLTYFIRGELAFILFGIVASPLSDEDEEEEEAQEEDDEESNDVGTSHYFSVVILV